MSADVVHAFGSMDSPISRALFAPEIQAESVAFSLTGLRRLELGVASPSTGLCGFETSPGFCCLSSKSRRKFRRSPLAYPAVEPDRPKTMASMRWGDMAWWMASMLAPRTPASMPELD